MNNTTEVQIARFTGSKITFTFDDLRVLGGIGKEVYIEGCVDSERAVLVFTRVIFRGALECWLDDKNRYCCLHGIRVSGIISRIAAIEYTEYPADQWLTLLTETEEIDEEGNPIYRDRPVRTFDVISFNPETLLTRI
jgi:hypothetical protein